MTPTRSRRPDRTRARRRAARAQERGAREKSAYRGPVPRAFDRCIRRRDDLRRACGNPRCAGGAAPHKGHSVNHARKPALIVLIVFADTLDGLIMVDVREVEEAVLVRYMGKQGAAAFPAYHALDTVPTGTS